MDANMVRVGAKGSANGTPTSGAQRGGRASLAQLESVLQRLSKHEERAQIQSVERTSTEMQQKLLRDQLLKVQEELALAQTSKSKLCEQMGALQQSKSDQEKQNEQLLAELRASRESLATMNKKIAELEQGSHDMKRFYIRSLSCRVKTAGELLGKLHIVHAIGDEEDVQNKCASWIDTQPNKRKRAQVSHHTRESEVPRDEPMGESEWRIVETVQAPAPSGDKKLVNPAETSSSQPMICEDREKIECIEHQSDQQGGAEDRPCQSCIDLTLENTSFQIAAAGEKEQLECALKEIKAQIKDLEIALEEANGSVTSQSLAVKEKNDTIVQLKAELQAEREKIAAVALVKQTADDESKDGSGEEISSRFKALEDNLTQLNTYADHLEMIITQCASCSVKLQSENTQN